MNNVITAFALIAFTQTTTPDEYTLLCQTEQSTGMNWRNGAWEQVRFKLDQKIVTVKSSNECWQEIDGELKQETSRVAVREICLNARKFGEPYEATKSVKCTEIHMDETVQVQCYNGAMTARYIVDGRFVASSISGVLTDPAPAAGRDSIFVETGRCSSI